MPKNNVSSGGVSRRTLAEQVYDVLKEEIILQKTPEMKMGMKIKEVEIAKRLGCSATPVREAINMLRQDNLIVANAFHISEVVSFSQKDIRDLLLIRSELEVSAIRQAMPNLSTTDVTALRRIHEEYVRVRMSNDFARISAMNNEFHAYILLKAENRTLRKLVEGLSDQAALLRAPLVAMRRENGASTMEKRPHAIVEHERILIAVEAGDVEAACEAMRNHMDRVHQEVCDYYAKADLKY